MGHKELTKYQRDLIVERYESGEGYKIISKALNIIWCTMKTVINKWRKCGTTVTLSRTGKKKKTGQGGCQQACRNIQGDVGISGTIWSCSTCSTYVYAVGTAAFSVREKHPSLAQFCNKIHPAFLKACGKCVMV